MNSIDPFEVRSSFTTLDAWKAFWRASPWITDAKHMGDIVAHARSHGVSSDFLGPIPAAEVITSDTNYRETFIAREFNSRQRALLDLTHEAISAIPRHLARIYAHEALTKLALLLRGRYVRFVGSEYGSSKSQKEDLFPILCVDIARSPFPDSVFDLVVSGDVLEHVPDLDAALADTARILKPGGTLLATFPFASGSQETIVRAKLVGGDIEHLMEPEYHGNPTTGDRSLVFQIPGWSILERSLTAGFSSAEILFWCSRSRGFTGGDIAGIFVLRAIR